MSRRSLRLDSHLLDQSLPLSSASFSVGGANWRNSRSSKSRRSQQLSVSCSESLLHSPHTGAFNQSLHSDVTDASLMSSLLEESSVHESTVLENIWESTVVADPPSSTQSSSIPKGSEAFHLERPVESQNREQCQDRYSWMPARPLSVSGERDLSSHTPIIYSRERNRTKCSGRCRRGCVINQKDSGSNLRQEDQHLCADCKKKQVVRPSPWTTMEIAGTAAGNMFRWISGRWFNINASILVRVPLNLVLVLLPLLFLAVFSWRSAVSDEQALPVGVNVMDQMTSPGESAVDPTYVHGLEQSLRSLWKRLEEVDRQAEQRHDEIQRLQANIQQLTGQCNHGGRRGAEFWSKNLVDTRLKRRWDEIRLKEQVHLEKSCLSRLDQLDHQVQMFAESLQDLMKNETSFVVSSDAVDQQFHQAVQSEFAGLKEELREVREAVDGLSSSQDGRKNLDLEMMVRKDLHMLVFGNQQVTLHEVNGPAADESLLQLLSQRFVSKEDVEQAVESLGHRLLQDVDQQLQVHHKESDRDSFLQTSGVTREEVNTILTDALRTFSQDKIGLADYALESGGGSILNSLCSETYETKAALLSLFGVPLWYFSQSPRVVIQPEVQPGNCWAFRGSTGYLTIRLSMKIFPTMVSLEHIPKSLAPGGTLSSAPRDFNVYGLDEADEEPGVLLGTFTYDQDGESLQSFSVAVSAGAFQIIKVHVLSNWGHQDYTCMYRFRVHGSPAQPSLT
ncbi:SUN domain-containing protein 1-like isoform 2-T2 [Synchiropus picturatus]